ncbi:hypothetical protein [Sphingomonas sp.]|uniref:hypothetical protein n=1 Tax=Sphingomonas sp. TaxID=28214 RepID=UPI002E307DBC|nr:hypothetical protein [Sphingomonas sp.]HEX4694047.1 hypothetical protein [Sphingomonas sp.]
MTLSRKKMVLIAVALVALVAGGLVAFLVPSNQSGPSSGSHSTFGVLIVLYASLIPVYAAAARRRRDKNNDG